MAHCRPQASFTDSFEDIFPSRMVFITKFGPQVSLSPVPFFGVNRGLVDSRLSYQSSYGFASGQIPHRSQGTLLPSSGEPKVSNPWNNVQRKDSI
jgi:hypothetical protein